MRDKVYTLDEIRSIAAPIAERHGVTALYLFGSYARGEAAEESDLDFRIEKGSIRSLFQLADFRIALEDGFQKKLDVLTTPMLSEQFLESIRAEEVLIYARGPCKSAAPCDAGGGCLFLLRFYSHSPSAFAMA